jgi:hypothetical protein
MLFTIPTRPIILFVATAIIEMLDTMRKVKPPFCEVNCVTQSANPISRMGLCGKWIPPFSAKLTELNKPPMIKKYNMILIIPRLIGLRVSAGLTALSVIFRPKINPTKMVGKYIISVKYGVSSVNL